MSHCIELKSFRLSLSAIKMFHVLNVIYLGLIKIIHAEATWSFDGLFFNFKNRKDDLQTHYFKIHGRINCEGNLIAKGRI